MAIVIQAQGQSITVGSAVPIGTGEANDGANLGGGAQVYAGKTAATLEFKSITGSNGVAVTQTATEIDVAGPASLGDVIGPAASTPNAPAQFDGATGKLLKDPNANFDMGGNAITNVGNVDGRDVSSDGANLDGHISDLANPHATTAALVGADPAGTATAAVAAHEAAPNPHPQYTDAAEAAAAAPVQSVNTQTGAVVLGAGDVGADPAGTSAAGIAAHEAAPDPHSQYTTAAEAALAAPVQDVNGEVGNVVLNAVDVGADATGTAAAQIANHEVAFNHAGIPTASQKAALDAATAPSGGNPVATIADLPVASTGDVVGPAGATADNLAAFDGATGKLIKDSGAKVTDFVDISDLTAHTSDLANPHATTALQVAAIPTADKGVANGVATLDGSGKVPSSQIPPLAISETFVVVSEAAMLALPADIGDVAIRTDIGKSFILRVTPPTAIGSWEEILAPGTGITSVNGDPGPAVSLDTDDVPEGITNEYYTDAKVDANPNVAANTAHRGIIAGNPHGTAINDLAPGSLAQLNTKITDATLDDSSDSRPPSGAASGDLLGTYPSPTVVAATETAAGKIEIATQLEVDAGTDDLKAVTPLKLANATGLPVGTHVSTHENGGADELDVSGLSGTLADPQNPTTHALGGAAHSADTLANLNSLLSDATLIDTGDPRLSDARVPLSHASTHELAGGDDINVAGLSGLLADAQTPLSHVSTHQDGGADELNVGGLSGLLADPQTPSAHAATHQNGGTDEISVTGLSGLLADAQTPLGHAASHLPSGADPLTTAAPGQGIGGGNSEGTAESFARSDHDHTIRETGGPADLTVGAIPDANFVRRSGTALVGFSPREQYAVSAGESSTTSGTFQQKLRLTTPTLEAGDYRIEWYYERSMDDENQPFMGQVQIDDTTTIHSIAAVQKKKYGDFTPPVYNSEAGFAVATLTSAVHTIDLDWAATGAKVTYIRNARLSIRRVA